MFCENMYLLFYFFFLFSGIWYGKEDNKQFENALSVPGCWDVKFGRKKMKV